VYARSLRATSSARPLPIAQRVSEMPRRRRNEPLCAAKPAFLRTLAKAKTTYASISYRGAAINEIKLPIIALRSRHTRCSILHPGVHLPTTNHPSLQLPAGRNLQLSGCDYTYLSLRACLPLRWCGRVDFSSAGLSNANAMNPYAWRMPCVLSF
jgi:hypothetical protein